MAAPLASLNARTSSALARPCSLIFASLTPLRRRQSNESRVSTPRSDWPKAVIVGATSSRIQCVTASAIGQRSVAAGERAMRCLSARSTASSETTSVALQSPGPVMDGKGLKSAISASRDRHADTAVSALMRSPGIPTGRARGSGMISAVTGTVVASRRAIAPRTFT